MANKKVTDSNDPLVDVHFKITKSQKDFLDDLDKSSSAFIRQLIHSQMSSHEVELSKLREVLLHNEAEGNIIKSQIQELESEAMKQQLSTKGREELLDRQVSSLVNRYQELGLDDELKKVIKVRVSGINERLTGTGAEQVMESEFIEQLKQESERVLENV